MHAWWQLRARSLRARALCMALCLGRPPGLTHAVSTMRWGASAAAAVAVCCAGGAHGWSAALHARHLPLGSTTSRAAVVGSAAGAGRVWGGGVRMQVWSDSRAIQEYQDLLSGKAPEEKADGPSVIVGGGRIGRALEAMGMGEDVVVGRGEAIPLELPGGLTEFPIYVTVKEKDVADVIMACPAEKRCDLVFLQGGNIEPLLKRFALAHRDQTQGLLSWVFESTSPRPRDGMVSLGLDKFGEPKVAGETCACGKWGGALKNRLARGGLPCTLMFYNDWRRNMYERCIYQSVFNLVGALHGYPTAGDVARYYHEEVADLCYELSRALRATFAVTMLLGLEERVLAYAAETADKEPTSMNPEDFEWRNGFFYNEVTAPARKIGFPDPCEQHSLYLEYGRDNKLFTLP